MVRRISIFVSSVLLITLITGCMGAMISSGVKSAIESTAVGGEFLISSKAKPGDYAVYKRVVQSSNVFSGTAIDIYSEFTDRYEVVSSDESGFIVRQTSTGESVETKVNGETSRKSTKEEIADQVGIPVTEYHLDKKGAILKVLYKNDKLGIDTMFKMAEAGEDGYIQYIPGKQNLEIKTGAGTYQTNPVFYTTKLSTTSSNRYSTSNVASVNYNITYINPDVKFKKVTAITTFVSDIDSSMDTAKMVNDITSVLSLTTFVTNPSSLISSAKNILDFAKMNPLPGKDTILNASIQNYEMTLKGVKGSMVEYLVEQWSL